MTLRAIIADDHPMCREAARIALGLVAPDSEVVQAGSLADVLAETRSVDLVILDLGLPDSQGIASLIDVARGRPSTPILIVSGTDRPDAEARAAANGAAGFVSKAAPIERLIDAIRTVVGGGTHFTPGLQPAAPDGAEARLATLTPAEARVLRAMRGGGLNKQIAFELGLSEITIKQHVKAILRKLDVVNRTQAVLMLHDVRP
ncbi:response regulator transcription factor [Sphingomonas sp.]|uniref:response regulator transcription factor n=1 Tax=Sphingomonas sp. TaxID=28214 RepID=UPI002C83B1A6|nr:response regulator transcription factor [Sphingomonas sp.]HTG38053.1 response regulator transcription factor [Sphingomonas sp.]